MKLNSNLKHDCKLLFVLYNFYLKNNKQIEKNHIGMCKVNF